MSETADGQCPKCELTFVDSNALKQHMITHEEMKILRCELCMKNFKYHAHLKAHMKQHAGIQSPHKCELCYKTFPSPYMLRRHQFSHSKEKNYRCEICLKMFKHYTHMRTHVRRHETPIERPHQCDLCYKSFPTQFMLKRHQISHTNERKFQCDLCDKMFKYENHMHIHRKQHLVPPEHQHHPYKCAKCPKSFPNQYSLKRHQISHSDEKNFQCEICSKKFKYESHLKGHLKKHLFAEGVGAQDEIEPASILEPTVLLL